MVSQIHNWFVLKKLEQRRAAANRDYEWLIEDAKKKQAYDEALSLQASESDADEKYLNLIDAEVTKQLTHIAHRLHLPVPPKNDLKYWKSNEETELCVPILNRDGICYLRDAIRDEKKERRAIWFTWLDAIGKILTIIIGLVGVLIGLISVLSKR
jgi:hypothetical protein